MDIQPVLTIGLSRLFHSIVCKGWLARMLQMKVSLHVPVDVLATFTAKLSRFLGPKNEGR